MCASTVVAATPVEVLAIPRMLLIKLLHKNEHMMEVFLKLVRTRRTENHYFRFGHMPVMKAGGTVLAMLVLRRALMRRVRAMRACHSALPKLSGHQ